MDDGDRFSYFVRKIFGKRLTYNHLTGKTENATPDTSKISKRQGRGAGRSQRWPVRCHGKPLGRTALGTRAVVLLKRGSAIVQPALALFRRRDLRPARLPHPGSGPSTAGWFTPATPATTEGLARPSVA